MERAYIGTSGWNYKHWSDGVFYPKHLRASEWLRFYAQHFDTVEINNSFYRLPSEAAFQNWRTQVPPEFIFSVKASRFITHIKRLKDPPEPLDLFFSRAKHLKNRLGAVLFQLPPRFKLDLDRLKIFLDALKKHTAKQNRRCAIEFRDATWLVPEVFELLEQRRVALCFADWRDVPITQPVTADFVYVRRHHGPDNGNYPNDHLDRDVDQIRKWIRARLDVYLYFNNDIGGHAIRNAKYVEQTLLDKINSGSGRRKQAEDSARRQDSLRP